MFRPPRERPIACFYSPFTTGGRAVGFDVRRVDHLRVFRSSIPSKLPESFFPDAAPGPADKSVIDRGRWSILRRAIAPATTAFQYLHNAADDAAIIGSFDTAHVRRQVRFDPLPLLIA